ncbi:MAG: 3D domain-containing protein [Pyrinomonadaceae bacterium]
MSKSLLGGSAVLMCALLPASLTFYAQTTAAVPLAGLTPETQIRAKSDSQAAVVSQDIGRNEVALAIAAMRRDVPVEVRPDLRVPAELPAKGNQKGTNKGGIFGEAGLFTATAYALRGRTASGQSVRRGLIAADRSVLPLGSRVRLDAGPYSGEYLVADRGSAIRGRKIDIWVPSNGEAMRFGRRKVKLTVLSYGGRRATSRRG